MAICGVPAVLFYTAKTGGGDDCPARLFEVLNPYEATLPPGARQVKRETKNAAIFSRRLVKERSGLRQYIGALLLIFVRGDLISPVFIKQIGKLLLL
jgi:hypothetical protein